MWSTAIDEVPFPAGGARMWHHGLGPCILAEDACHLWAPACLTCLGREMVSSRQPATLSGAGGETETFGLVLRAVSVTNSCRTSLRIVRHSRGIS